MRACVATRYEELAKGGSIKETLMKHLDATSFNLVIMGSVELSDTTKKIYLGSVSQARPPLVPVVMKELA